MKYLREVISEDLTESKVLTEGTGKKYVIEGVFMQSNVKNANNRMYPESTMDREANKFINEKILTHKAVGELNHPPEGRDPRIDYEFVSHKITSLIKEGYNWIGKAVITTGTPKGALVAGLMDEGVVMGVSSRALGDVKKVNNVNVVQENFYLITPADIVADPSAPDAFVTNLMENKEWIYENGILVQKEIEDLQDNINTLARNNQLNQPNLLNIFEYIFDQKLGRK